MTLDAQANLAVAAWADARGLEVQPLPDLWKDLPASSVAWRLLIKDEHGRRWEVWLSSEPGSERASPFELLTWDGTHAPASIRSQYGWAKSRQLWTDAGASSLVTSLEPQPLRYRPWRYIGATGHKVVRFDCCHQ